MKPGRKETPVDISISKSSGDTEYVSIIVRSGPKKLVRIEMDITEFAQAIMGLSVRPATLVTYDGEQR